MDIFIPKKKINIFINKQILDLKKGGVKKLFIKILVMFKLLICFINPFYYLAILLVIFFRLISVFFIVRIGYLNSVKIGHFSMNTELYFCKRDAGINVPDKPYIDFFYFEKYICNKQLSSMWKKKLNILPHFFLFPIHRVNKIVNFFVPGGHKHEVHSNDNIYQLKNLERLKKISTHRDIYNLLEKTEPYLHFTDKEIKKGEILLRNLGVPEKAKIVCLVIRDKAYLNKNFNYEGANWNYHNYRDQNIENYLLAAEELAERGYYVFRMGKIVSTKMNSTNPKIIDYANLRERSDFLDIYIAYKCKFCIRTAGFGGITQIFRKPSIYIEGPAADLTAEDPNSLLLLPNYYLIKEKKNFHFQKYLS